MGSVETSCKHYTSTPFHTVSLQLQKIHSNSIINIELYFTSPECKVHSAFSSGLVSINCWGKYLLIFLLSAQPIHFYTTKLQMQVCFCRVQIVIATRWSFNPSPNTMRVCWQLVWMKSHFTTIYLWTKPQSFSKLNQSAFVAQESNCSILLYGQIPSKSQTCFYAGTVGDNKPWQCWSVLLRNLKYQWVIHFNFTCKIICLSATMWYADTVLFCLSPWSLSQLYVKIFMPALPVSQL